MAASRQVPVEKTFEELTGTLDFIAQLNENLCMHLCRSSLGQSLRGIRKFGKRHFLKVANGLAKLPVRGVAKRNAHLHLWTPPEASPCGDQGAQGMGIPIETCLVSTKGRADYGRYWRPAHDLLLLGVRGNLAFRDNELLSWIDA